MIRTNLATRPFFNVRLVHGALLALGLSILVITVLNVAQYARLSASQRTLGGQAQTAEREAARLRAEAAQIRARIDPKELEVVAEAAREANAIIDRRAFSWTQLFTHLEMTLPPDVRITSLTPRPEDNSVDLGAEARSIEDLETFIEALETTGAFHNVFAADEVTMENGSIVARIAATYQDTTTPAEGAQ